MSKTVKKLIAFFTLLCVVVLMVFCVELLLLNKNSGDGTGAASSQTGKPGGTHTGAPSTPPTDTPPQSETPPIGGGPDTSATSPGTDEPPNTAPSAPNKEQHQIRLADDIALSVSINPNKFDYEQQDMGDIFIYKGGGSATLEIVLDYLPFGAAERAKGFLDMYTDKAQAIIEEEKQVGQSKLIGTHVLAMKGEITYEAWICDIPADDNTAFDLIIQYRELSQKEAIYDILGTMELVTADSSSNNDILTESPPA